MDQEVKRDPEEDAIGVEENREANTDSGADELDLQNREVRLEQEPDHRGDGEYGGNADVHDVGAEQVAIFRLIEHIAVRAALLEAEPPLEDATAAAIWAVTDE